MVSRVILIALLLALGACSMPQQRPETTAPPPPVRPDVTPAEPPRQQPDGSAKAVEGLLQQAREALQEHNALRAENLLQRAQRIAPRDAAVYLEYARFYDSLGEVDQASAMAERGLLYCRDAECGELRSLVR